jgi:four helix bundle protein
MAAEGKTKSYKDLLVWRKGIDLVKETYLLTSQFPPEERFGLSVQMRRAAVSLPSTIAEGQARKSSAEFKQFLSIAQGSLAALETRLTITSELRLCSERQTEASVKRIEELQRMLRSLQKKLSARQSLATRHSSLATQGAIQ